jgi:arylsulfatase A-like enzyme
MFSKHATFGEIFKKSGYDTFQTGKWHLFLDDWQRSFTHGKAVHEKGGHWNAEFTDYDSSKSLDRRFLVMKVASIPVK